LGVIQLTSNSGTVTGLVTDSQSHPIGGVQVSVASGAMTLAATTDATGRYTVVNLLPGSVTVIVFDPASALRSRATGALVAGATLTLNLPLVASGSVTGLVFRNGGTIPAARVPVTLTSTGAPAFGVTDVFGRYSFDVAPLGAITVDASDPATGDRGRATGTLASNATFTAVEGYVHGLDLTSDLLPQPRLKPTQSGSETLDVPAFTDLKLHDISSGPGDPNAERLDMNQSPWSPKFAAGNTRFLTRRLWDSGSGPPYYHHGMFTTMRQSILAHAGEALVQRRAFESLPDEDKDSVIEFLKTLQVLPPGTRDRIVDERYRGREWPPSIGSGKP
jgi:hypothetical protein